MSVPPSRIRSASCTPSAGCGAGGCTFSTMSPVCQICARVGDDLRARRDVVVVAKRGAGAGVVFDGHREAHLDEPRDVFGGDRHPAFAGAAFFRDGELHVRE